MKGGSFLIKKGCFKVAVFINYHKTNERSDDMHYYLNICEEPYNPSHTHKVHRESCYWLPAEKNRKYLGDYSNGKTALECAKTFYPEYCPIDRCKCCCPYIDYDGQMTLFS